MDDFKLQEGSVRMTRNRLELQGSGCPRRLSERGLIHAGVTSQDGKPALTFWGAGWRRMSGHLPSPATEAHQMDTPPSSSLLGVDLFPSLL